MLVLPNKGSSGQERVVPPTICAELLIEHTSLKYLHMYPKLDLIYLYDEERGFYKELKSSELEILVKTLLRKVNVVSVRSSKYLRSVISDLKSDESVSNLGEPSFDKEHVVLENGVLNLQTREFKEWSPQYFVTTRLPFSYREEADCPRFLRYIEEFCSNYEDRIQFIRAFLNAVLFSRVDLQIFLYAWGPGGTGQSVLSKIATALVGKDGTITTTLKSLHSDQFELTNIRGKKLILISDTEYYKGDVSTLKALVGGDALRGRIKYVQGSYEVTPEGIVMIQGNHPLGVRDSSNAILRRMRIFKATNVSKVRKNLLSYERTHWSGPLSEELAGIFNWVVNFDQDQVESYLLDMDRMVPSLQGDLLEAQGHINPLAQWAKEELQKGPGSYVGYVSAEGPKGFVEMSRRKALYPTYAAWVKRHGSHPLAHTKFTLNLIETLKGMGYSCERIRKNTGMYISGVQIREGVYDRDYLYGAPLTSERGNPSECSPLTSSLTPSTSDPRGVTLLQREEVMGVSQRVTPSTSDPRGVTLLQREEVKGSEVPEREEVVPLTLTSEEVPEFPLEKGPLSSTSTEVTDMSSELQPLPRRGTTDSLFPLVTPLGVMGVQGVSSNPFRGKEKTLTPEGVQFEDPFRIPQILTSEKSSEVKTHPSLLQRVTPLGSEDPERIPNLLTSEKSSEVREVRTSLYKGTSQGKDPERIPQMLTSEQNVTEVVPLRGKGSVALPFEKGQEPPQRIPGLPLVPFQREEVTGLPVLTSERGNPSFSKGNTGSNLLLTPLSLPNPYLHRGTRGKDEGTGVRSNLFQRSVTKGSKLHPRLYPDLYERYFHALDRTPLKVELNKFAKGKFGESHDEIVSRCLDAYCDSSPLKKGKVVSTEFRACVREVLERGGKQIGKFGAIPYSYKMMGVSPRIVPIAYRDTVNNTKKVLRTMCYELLGDYAFHEKGMVLLDLDLVSCYTSILLGLYPDHLRALQLAIEGEGLWNYIKGEMERNGRGSVYNKAAVKICTYSSFFLGGNRAMMNGILEQFRKDSGLTNREFKDSPFYEECYKIAQDVTSEMQNSSVIVDFRAISEWIRKSYDGDFLRGPTGHSYLVTEETFRSAYPNYLQSYEFALLAQGTLETLKGFPQVEILGHYHDGNVLIVPLDQKEGVLNALSSKITSLGRDLGLRYPQSIELKQSFPNPLGVRSSPS